MITEPESDVIELESIYNKIKKTGGMVYGKDQEVAQNTCYDADSSYDVAECTVSYGICRCHK